jgi:hypothetical protein
MAAKKAKVRPQNPSARNNVGAKPKSKNRPGPWDDIARGVASGSRAVGKATRSAAGDVAKGAVVVGKTAGKAATGASRDMAKGATVLGKTAGRALATTGRAASKGAGMAVGAGKAVVAPSKKKPPMSMGQRRKGK